MMYGSEARCLSENKKSISKRTEKSYCESYVPSENCRRQTTEEQMDMLG